MYSEPIYIYFNSNSLFIIVFLPYLTDGDNNVETWDALAEYEDSSSQNFGQFQCTTCWRSYKTKRSLNRHERYDCGERLPSMCCPYCEYRARRNYQLTHHLGTAHKITIWNKVVLIAAESALEIFFHVFLFCLSIREFYCTSTYLSFSCSIKM